MYLEPARRGERIRVTLRGAVIAEITGPEATGEEAGLIRGRLRGTVLRYDLPAEPAHAPGEWTVNRPRYPRSGVAKKLSRKAAQASQRHGTRGELLVSAISSSRS